jgi:hypothetical protein
MSSHEYEDDLGFFTIVGEVRNDLQMNVGKVLVTATFYNASGDVIEEASNSTMIDILLPGQRSPFALILPKPADLWEYSLRIHGPAHFGAAAGGPGGGPKPGL